MLMSPIYKEILIALVVDEAHCVKTWGDKFRKTFANIGELRSIITVSVKVVALTATATTETFFTVTCRLSMDNPNLVALPPNRDITHLSVQEIPGQASQVSYASLTRLFPRSVRESGLRDYLRAHYRGVLIFVY